MNKPGFLFGWLSPGSIALFLNINNGTLFEEGRPKLKEEINGDIVAKWQLIIMYSFLIDFWDR